MKTTALTEEEVHQLRAETKGTAQRIHFNNAGASLPPDIVVDTVIGYLREEAVYGGYEADHRYKEQLSNAYALIARLINADVDEIAVVENASTAWGIGFYGVDFKKGDEVITSEMEYVTNLLAFLHAQQTQGITFRVIPNDERGNFSLPALEAAISPNTKLIAITHIASTTGGMMPIAEIGQIAAKHGILYLVDACQSAGHVPLDVRTINCDMLAVTGRKYLRGPRGTGFLYVRKSVLGSLKQQLMDGFSTQWVSDHDYKLKDNARRFELFEKNRALVLGLGKAAEYALNIGVERIWQRIQLLAGLLREQLRHIEGITLHDAGDQQCGIVTFTVKGMDCQLVRDLLAAKQINVSVGFAQSTLFYMHKHRLDNIVRASVHYYNTEEEIHILGEALKEMIKA